MKRQYVTGVGSRETPEYILVLMQFIAFKLAKENWCWRSGYAPGADYAFYRGVEDLWDTSPNPDYSLFQTFLPWKNFSKRKTPLRGEVYVGSELPGWNKALLIAEKLHPAWHLVSGAGKNLHARNVFQVLGPSLNEPSQAIVYWAKTDKHGTPQGGTRTAWAIAKKCGVKKFINLFDEVEYKKALRWVGVSEERLLSLAASYRKEEKPCNWVYSGHKTKSFEYIVQNTIKLLEADAEHDSEKYGVNHRQTI